MTKRLWSPALLPPHVFPYQLRGVETREMVQQEAKKKWAGNTSTSSYHACFYFCQWMTDWMNANQYWIRWDVFLFFAPHSPWKWQNEWNSDCETEGVGSKSRASTFTKKKCSICSLMFQNKRSNTKKKDSTAVSSLASRGRRQPTSEWTWVILHL